MDRREFFASSLLPLATVSQPVEQKLQQTSIHCSKSYPSSAFVVTNDEVILKSKLGCNQVWFVDRKAFDKVREWLAPRKEHFIHALNTLYKGQKGTSIYWEEGYHEKIVPLLVEQTGFTYRSLSDALCVFESDPNLLDDTK
jgi:hypothetical protein